MAVDRVSSTRRSRGVRAGLDRRQIIDAARTLDPGAVTMQAVADVLGVDRKAVNHHVSDRETLLGLVAVDAFSEHFRLSGSPRTAIGKTPVAPTPSASRTPSSPSGRLPTICTWQTRW